MGIPLNVEDAKIVLEIQKRLRRLTANAGESKIPQALENHCEWQNLQYRKRALSACK